MNCSLDVIEPCRAGGIGDVLMCTPALREFKRLNPSTKVKFYASHHEVLRNLSYIDELRPFSERPDRSIWLNYESAEKPITHIAKIFGRQLGISVDDVRPDCFITKSLVDKFQTQWSNLPRPWITFNRRASNWTPNKDWPDLYWQELVERLDGRCGLIEIGSATSQAIPLNGSTYISLVGGTDISELVAAIAACDLHIGPISGPVHIAAAARRPSIVIYSGYEPVACTMYEGNTVLYSKIDCSPCWLREPCPYQLKCLQMVEVDNVIDAIQAMWSAPNAKDATETGIMSFANQEGRALKNLDLRSLAAPAVLKSDSRNYLAYRPDSDRLYDRHPELRDLAHLWVNENFENNSGDLPRLFLLSLNIKQILADKIPGDFAELGVYKGNSASVLAHYARTEGKSTFLFDTFSGFNAEDLGGVDLGKVDNFKDTSIDSVLEITGTKDVRCVQGRFPHSVTDELRKLTFAFVHLDCDLYEPTRTGLEFFYPRLSAGGMLVIHDYVNEYWGGVKMAVDEFCRSIPERPVIMPDKSGTAIIRKCFY